MRNQLKMATRTSIRFFSHWDDYAIATIDYWESSCPYPTTGDTIRLGEGKRYRVMEADFSIGKGINLCDYMVMELPYNDPEDSVS